MSFFNVFLCRQFFVSSPRPFTIHLCVDVWAGCYHLTLLFWGVISQFSPCSTLDRLECPWTCPPLSKVKNEKPLSSLSVGHVAADRKLIWCLAQICSQDCQWHVLRSASPARAPLLPARCKSGCRCGQKSPSVPKCCGCLPQLPVLSKQWLLSGLKVDENLLTWGDWCWKTN